MESSVHSFGSVLGIDFRTKDEDAVVHIWQLLIAGQLPLILLFAIQWLARAPRTAVAVVALQVGAVMAAVAPVYLLKL